MLIVVGDPHFTDNQVDAYRFGLFPWLQKQQYKYKPMATIILGDLTNSKDKHAGKLVNKIVDGLVKLEPPVFVLMGNHDYIDPNDPFFRFLNWMEGVSFVTCPTEIPHLGLAFIPHCRTQDELNKSCEAISRPKHLFLHQTFEGAIAESGGRLSGLSAAPVAALKAGAVWAGDVHKPQQAGLITYVGAPYHVRFGDNFTPRVILADRKAGTDLFFKAPRKWSLTVRSYEEVKADKRLAEGDQVKLTIELSREEVVEWKNHKASVLKACAERGLEVFGVDLKVNSGVAGKVKATDLTAGRSNADVVAAFCKKEKTPSQMKRAGLEILKG